MWLSSVCLVHLLEVLILQTEKKKMFYLGWLRFRFLEPGLVGSIMAL